MESDIEKPRPSKEMRESIPSPFPSGSPNSTVLSSISLRECTGRPEPGRFRPWRIVGGQFRSMLNGLRRANMAVAGVVTVIAIVFAAGLFFGTDLFLNKLNTIPFIAATLKLRLLYMILLSLFFMLLFSNLVTALSTLFSSRELDLLLSVPCPMAEIGMAKFFETLVKSSWLTVFVSIPIYLAYKGHFSPDPYMSVVMALSLAALLVLTAACSVIAGIVAARLFSADQTRKFLQLLGAVTIIGLIFLIRALKPEEFMHPEKFMSFVNFMTTIDTPYLRYLPPRWAMDIIEAVLTNQRIPWMQAGVLTLASLGSIAVMILTVKKLFLVSWNRSQEILATDMVGRNRINATADLAEDLLGGQAGAILSKEIRTFFRNPALWSQLFMIFAIGVIYFYNIYLLPVDAAKLISQDLPQLLSFLNIAFIGFIISAVAARFVFPAVSIEGKAYWIMLSSPVGSRCIYLTKLAAYTFPTTGFALLLSWVSNRILAVPGPMAWFSHVNTVVVSVTICTIALTIGAMKPNFNEENVAGIPVSVGGFLFMILSLSFTGILLALSAYPLVIMTSYNFYFRFLPFHLKAKVAGATAAWLATATLTIWGSIRLGIRSIR